MSALNPALFDLEVFENSRWNKTRRAYVHTVPGAILPSGPSAPLAFARGPFQRSCAVLSSDEALGQLLPAAAHIRAACAQSRSARSSWQGGTTPNGSGSERRSRSSRRQGRLLMLTTFGLVAAQ